MINELSLFSGAGGGLLGSKLLGWKTIGYVEFNDYCQRVIRQRIEDGILDNAPIFGDIISFIDQGYAARYRGLANVISAGFPCQPFSVAGKQLGEDDPRNKWPETRECIRIIRPNLALLENVTGLLGSGYFGTIISDLHKIGYNARWCTVSASDIGAPHKRERIWILAYAESELSHSTLPTWSGWNGSSNCCSKISNTNKFDDDNSGYGASSVPLLKETTIRPVLSNSTGQRLERKVSTGRIRKYNRLSPQCNWWTTEPELGRVAHGVANRVDRLKAIGNGQVPMVVRAAWEILSEGLI